MEYEELYEKDEEELYEKDEEDVYGIDDFEDVDEEDEDFLPASDTSDEQDAFLDDVREVDSLSAWYEQCIRTGEF